MRIKLVAAVLILIIFKTSSHKPNSFDPGKVAKDLTSKESIRGLATSAAIAGITFGITEATGFGAVSAKMSKAQRFQGIAEKGLLQGGVNSAVTGQDLGKSLQQQAGSNMLAIGQSVIGDIGVAHGLKDGGIAKTLMHAGAGATYSAATGSNFAAGALGGAIGEVLAPVTESPELAKVAAASLALATGGNVRSIETAGAVAASGAVYNFGLHPKPTWEQEEARQKQVEQASELVVDYVAENPEVALDVVLTLGAIALPEIAAPVQWVRAAQASKVASTSTKTVAATTKNVGHSGKVVQKVVEDKGEKLINATKKQPTQGEKFHKNSHKYEGESHVYGIKDKINNKTHKIGESAQGIRKSDGRSIRAELQARKLERETGGKFETKIYKNFKSKKEAYKHENEVIKRYKKLYKDSGNLLPGNKGDH